jgi:quinol monooxygenase YgiN
MPTTEIAIPVVRESSYIVVWEFQVKPECTAEFVAAYGPDGEWARLFRRSPEFVEVELVGSAQDPGRFYTLDHWTSAAAMESFLSANATAYDVLDRRLTGLTLWELRVGAYAGDS